jgi:ribosome-binding factor A
MRPPHHRGGRAKDSGPSQRQLRAGELVRHALADILAETDFADLNGASVTVTEVRLSPDFRHANCFIQPLGGQNIAEVVTAMNRHASYLRGRLGRLVDMKFTPDLRFHHDQSFEAAAKMDRLFDSPEVRRDIGREAAAPDMSDRQFQNRLSDVLGDDEDES